MCKIRTLVVIVVSFMVFNETTGMNEKQMFAAVKVVRNVCQPKTKASAEDIDKMHKGDWNVDHSAMCYMYCALNMYKLINEDNTLNYETGIKQMKMLPDSYRPFVTECMEQCKDAAVTLSDKCVSAYEMTKCMYVCNPEKYMLP